MKPLQTSNSKPSQAESPRREADMPPQNEEILAWEPLGDDLWLPHRIRGSWRGGVLG